MEKVISTDRGTFLIRSYENGDESGVLNLWEAAFGKPMPRNLFRWKWQDNPYGHQIMLCVSEDGCPVAMYSGIPYKANWEGETVRFTHLMDHSSHPAYRSALGGRRGLFVRTAAEFFDRYGGPHGSIFMYGFPGRRHFFLGQKLLQYVPLRGAMAFMSARPADMTFRVGLFKGRIEVVDSVSRAFDGLAEACRGVYPFSVLRDAVFLNWRFMKHPERKYEIWAYRSFLGGALKAYVVLFHEPGSSTMVDLISLDDGDGLKDFVARLMKAMAERGVGELKTWLPPDHFLSKGLVSGGFRIGSEPIGFTPGGRTFHDKLDMAQVSDQIFYTMADGDLS
jgi:hypothetical protein